MFEEDRQPVVGVVSLGETGPEGTVYNFDKVSMIHSIRNMSTVQYNLFCGVVLECKAIMSTQSDATVVVARAA